MMTKKELIERIEEMPDDLEAFEAKESVYDDIDIRIFTKPKEKPFYDWYFGM
jgi:hypothetical protein